MERHPRYILMLLLLLALPAARAQEITFTATVDRTTFAVGERIKLTLTLTNAQGRFGDPDLGGLVVVQGPFESSAYNFINGRASSTISRSYLLTATEPGDYTIGAAKAQVGGGSISSEPIKVHVEKAAGGGAGAGVLDQQQKQDRDLFATISLSRGRCYVGEQVVATYTLYCRYNAIELTSYDLPKLTGFWAEEIDMGQLEWEPALQTVNGLQYRVAIIKKQLLFPQKSGRLRIEPATLDCVVNRSFFSRGSNVKVRSNAAELTVQELPAGAPPDFSGAVGRLDMAVEGAGAIVKANEAIDLKVRFSGRANLKLLEAPKPRFPADFEVYDPKVSDKVGVTAAGMSGSREFQYLVIPRHEGTYTLAPIIISYFDPEKGAYQQLSSGPLTFTVEKGDGTGAAGSAAVTRPSRTDVQQLERDIRYIRTGDLELAPKGRQLFGSWPYVACMASPALALVLLLGWKRRRDAALADAAGMRRKAADKVARKRLSEAADALGRNDREAFYTALSKALHGYLADKFTLGVAEVNTATLRERLGAGEVADRFARLIDACAMARFAPVEDRSRQELYDEAAALITRIENEQRA
jgi:hypothetical protein